MIKKINIIPIINPPYFILEDIKVNLEKIFNVEVSLGDKITPKEIHKNFVRNQYYASKLIDYLKEMRINDADKILGVINEDIFDEGYNFLFGCAELNGKYSIISIYRLFDKNLNKFKERCIKEAVHEIGHTFGLNHCENKRCVMSFSLSLLEVDKKEKNFCEICEMKLNVLK
ncbi:MAG: archaemetzincin family Zn-dependent metalloprotease [Caldisericia bacterium]|jgi:archaemetzincin|nr:archaemetzincin family Zn-dependent metalloprotease [Caldisericia bacterium]